MNTRIAITTNNGYSCIITAICLEEAMAALNHVTRNISEYTVLFIN